MIEAIHRSVLLQLGLDPDKVAELEIREALDGEREIRYRLQPETHEVEVELVAPRG